jgi:hypothetical protein
MALLTVQQAVLRGTQMTLTAASAGGDTFPRPHDSVGLRVRNAGGSAITVTVVIPGTNSYGEAQPDVVSSSIPATTGDVILGPFPPEAVDPSTGLISVTYSGTTSVTVAAVAI